MAAFSSIGDAFTKMKSGDPKNSLGCLERSLRQLSIQLERELYEDVKQGEVSSCLLLLRELLYNTSASVTNELVLVRSCPSTCSDRKLVLVALDILRERARVTPQISAEQFLNKRSLGEHRILLLYHIAHYVSTTRSNATPAKGRVVDKDAAAARAPAAGSAAESKPAIDFQCAYVNPPLNGAFKQSIRETLSEDFLAAPAAFLLAKTPLGSSSAGASGGGARSSTSTPARSSGRASIGDGDAREPVASLPVELPAPGSRGDAAATVSRSESILALTTVCEQLMDRKIGVLLEVRTPPVPSWLTTHATLPACCRPACSRLRA